MGIWYTLGVALFAAIGTFLFVSIYQNHVFICLHYSDSDWDKQGFDTGIATTSKYIGRFSYRTGN